MDMQPAAFHGADIPVHPVMDLDRKISRKVIASVFNNTVSRPGHADLPPFWTSIPDMVVFSKCGMKKTSLILSFFVQI